MHIILTHEQADFDALASLLGAHLLNDSAIPVLPRRMNRNVSAFLALYGVELPFVDPRDLPGDSVDSVTLVDTQSMVSVKGMGPHTLVQVIDHHPKRDGLPDNWTVTSVEIGATTTLLVEALRERNGALSPIQATLMLLGIYEDTGSLTYSRTNTRDLRAAAFLLEMGANLGIAADFLNHPLSKHQQELYDNLRTTARHLHIHGHDIVLACGDAQGMSEELSTIAHKMRDLLDPDAIFLLLNTRGGVQMIARSTSDHIDVAKVAADFGGGGHARAAASLIRDQALDDICNHLIDILPEHVHPAITVAQIMSSGPQLLSPETPVEEAAARMQRYGYEGYPVVENGKVIGLLTRRAVDRALSHKLNLKVTSLMEAGEHTVSPDDSIERLQTLVTDTGWGQIPVVQPESGEIVGIVTRTDLLKTLTPQPKVPGRLNLAARLETALPDAHFQLLKLIAAEAYEQQAALYIVGGFVRDLLLERPSLDFDLVVEGDAIKLARALARLHGGRVTSHARFGTAKWHLDESSPGIGRELSGTGLSTVDLVTARTEFYAHPTALPTVERGSIKLDLHRRDFTINTLALRLDGRHYGDLHDYWGGLDDIRQKLVRVLHSLSFVDDPTRILRAVRFEQRFEFHVEDRTMQLLMEARPLIDRLSGDRIRHELDHILASVRVLEIMGRLQNLELLKAVHPGLVWDAWLDERFTRLSQAELEDVWFAGETDSDRGIKRQLAYILWFIRLSTRQVARVIRRLKLPVKMRAMILPACELWGNRDELVTAVPSAIVARLEDVPLLSIYALYLATDDGGLRGHLHSYVHQWKDVSPLINGHDLRQLGVPPGPVYRKILGQLRSAWLDGQISTKEAEAALLKELLEGG
jgi:tRNA nucleotidyltransferase (CCA-adding enzyme)